MVSSKVIEKIHGLLKKNQESGKWQEKNYVSNIREKLGYTRPTIQSGLNVLENMDMIERKRKGRKKIIKLVDFETGIFSKESNGSGSDYLWD